MALKRLIIAIGLALVAAAVVTTTSAGRRSQDPWNDTFYDGGEVLWQETEASGSDATPGPSPG